MKTLVFSVLDAKAGYYGNPYYSQKEAEAIRSFSDAVNDGSNPNNMWYKHPEDFTLYLIGEFDSDIGVIKPLPKIIALVTASALKSVGSRQMEIPFEKNGEEKKEISIQ